MLPLHEKWLLEIFTWDCLKGCRAIMAAIAIACIPPVGQALTAVDVLCVHIT